MLAKTCETIGLPDTPNKKEKKDVGFSILKKKTFKRSILGLEKIYRHLSDFTDHEEGSILSEVGEIRVGASFHDVPRAAETSPDGQRFPNSVSFLQPADVLPNASVCGVPNSIHAQDALSSGLDAEVRDSSWRSTFTFKFKTLRDAWVPFVHADAS